MESSTSIDPSCRWIVFSVALLFFLIYVPVPSHAQSIIDVSATLARTTTISKPYLTVPGSTSSIATSYRAKSTPSSSTNSTTAPSTTLVTKGSTPSLFPPAGGGSITESVSPDDERKESVFNYYFLILGVFGVIVAVGLWWIRRRRKLQKERMRLSGQNALAQDLDGWINARRWMHGAWRNNETATIVRREEGLNERGEAPPPYELTGATSASHTTEATQDPASGLTIPLRALSREGAATMAPPEYQETDGRQGSTTSRPDTATPRATRPGTAEVQPGTSTSNLLRTEHSRPDG